MISRMTKVASEKFQSSQTNFCFRGSLPRGDGSGIIFLVPAAGGPRYPVRVLGRESQGCCPCTWACGQPWRTCLSACHALLAHVVSSSVDILILCSHICPLPRGGQFGSGDSVVGETRSANSLPLGTGARSQFCGSLQSSAQDQCCGGGDKDARELGTLLPLVATARPLEGAPAARVAGTQFTLADPCSVPRGSVERSTVSS